jgi:hypothetical protein
VQARPTNGTFGAVAVSYTPALVPVPDAQSWGEYHIGVGISYGGYIYGPYTLKVSIPFDVGLLQCI